MFISQQSELEEYCRAARAERVVAVDTEFLRERTFFPKLCLVQVNAGGNIALIDPLALEDLTPLAELMADENVTKVFHACSQDLEVLDHALGVIPAPIFDTQVACEFLGMRMQVGYGALVEAYEGVHLDKADSLTDWSRRPLDARQLEYAADDVRYLPGIYEKMISKLVEQNRLGWVAPEMEALVDPAKVRHDPAQAYVRLRRGSSLTRKQLAVAREVAIWREETAMRRDVPRKWVVNDEVLVEAARRAPANVPQLKRIRGTEQLSMKDAEALVAAAKRGLECPVEEQPKPRGRHRPSPETESIVDLMYAMLRIISDTSGVATQLIATRDDLVDLAEGKEGCALLESWRYELAGRQLQRLLSGEVGLTVKEGRVEIL